MPSILLTRSEAFDVLAVLYDAIDHVTQSRAYALVIHLLHAAELLGDKLFPDLPPAV